MKKSSQRNQAKRDHAVEVESAREELLEKLNVQTSQTKSFQDKATELGKKHLSTQESLTAQILRYEEAEETAAASERREKASQEQLKRVRT